MASPTGALRGARAASARSIAVDFKMLGIPELRDKFKALPLVLQRKVARQASRDVVKVWRRAASAYARGLTNPANKSERMVTIARTLTVRAIRRSRKFVGARLLTAERHRLGVNSWARWYFPAHIHLGRRVKNLRGSARGATRRAIAERVSKIGRLAYEVPPMPYLRNPLIYHGAEWNSLLGTLIRDGIEREAAKARLAIPSEVVID